MSQNIVSSATAASSSSSLPKMTVKTYFRVGLPIDYRMLPVPTQPIPRVRFAGIGGEF